MIRLFAAGSESFGVPPLVLLVSGKKGTWEYRLTLVGNELGVREFVAALSLVALLLGVNEKWGD